MQGNSVVRGEVREVRMGKVLKELEAKSVRTFISRREKLTESKDKVLERSFSTFSNVSSLSRLAFASWKSTFLLAKSLYDSVIAEESFLLSETERGM